MDGADDKGDVGAVVSEVPVDTGRTKNLKFLHDIASDSARERSGQRDDWCIPRKEDAYGANGPVFFAEGSSPVRYAVSFVYDERVYAICEGRFSQNTVNEPPRSEHLRREQHDAVLPSNDCLDIFQMMVKQSLDVVYRPALTLRCILHVRCSQRLRAD